MSICAHLCRLGTLSIAATLLFACSKTINLSQQVAPLAPAPQSITSLNDSSTATRIVRSPDNNAENYTSPETQAVPLQAEIPSSIASALATGINADLRGIEGATPSVVASTSVGSAELFGESATYSNQPFQRWLSVLTRFNAQQTDPQYACATDKQQSCALTWWNSFIAKLRALPLRERVTVVNDVLNRVPYVPGESNWGDAGYWETPLEFLTHAGQCQDYANAKYLALAGSGVPDSLMRFVVVRDRQQALDHAVLVVYVSGEPLVLDNQNTAVLPADQIDRYAPYYALNMEGAWTYPQPVPPVVLAGQIPAFPHPTFALARY